MNLCFSTLGCTESSMDEIIATAERFGICGLEIRGVGGVMKNALIPDFAPDAIADTRARFADKGLKPIVVGTSCAFHSPEKSASAAKAGRESIDIAAALGAPYIRVFGNNLVGDREECTARVIEGIRDLCLYAAERGVTVLLEVHGDFNTVRTLTPIVTALGHMDSFGLIWDVAHSHRVYHDNWREFYTAMRPYVRHVHLKDVRDADNTLVLPGEGNIPLLPIVRALLADGYAGYFSLEWEKKWHPELDDIEVALDRYVKLMAQI